MKKIGKDDITYQEFTYIIVGAIFGVGVLSLPNRLVEIARQDGWISAAIGGVYPVYIALLTIYISKKFPEDNILSISKKIFGKFIGSILNLLFSAQFFINLIGITSGAINLSIIYIVGFLNVLKVSIVVLILAVYGTYLGLKVVGRISELMYYLTAVLLIIPLIALKDGSLLNISPVLGAGVKNILKASVETGFSYSGVEIMLLIYPNVKDKSNLKSATLKSVMVIVFIYTYITFLTTYFAGPDSTLKSYFSVMLLNETINLPFLNSFRFVFMYMWIMIVFKTIINNYYSFTYTISNAIVKLNIKKMCIILYPIILVVVNTISNEATRRSFISKSINYTATFNIVFLSLVAIIIFFKKGEKNESI
ncbi:spore germination protein [Clostridium swellfunianum]|uniref:GerAB/ArcD/ProY family transporter n=1 Tax=Clostridium swellfunianum TaxID=1367462 RepID=UPI00202FA8D7|nr:endospore germination permease [Clostridium swellfunianum]MCM0650197.1 spore germination protein [Clostridium swellfunianum]